MTSSIALIGEHEYGAWEGYIRRSPEATLFHSTRWKQVVEQTYGCLGFYLAAREGDRIGGILPLFLCGSFLTGRALVALPFAATQPSVCADDAETERRLVAAAFELARQRHAGYVELREAHEKPWGWPVRQAYVNIRLPLAPDPDAVWRTRVESRVRTKVRNARRNGLHAQWGGPTYLKAFYALYAHTMHRLGSPPHARALFRNLFSAYPEQAEILLVFSDERPVAGAFVMHDDGWIGFPWAASRAEAHALRPNNLLYWTIIERACASGYDVLDMGRSSAGSGAMHFKMQWGAIARPLWYYFGLVRRPRPPARDASHPMMIRASQGWRRLPQRVATRLGPRLARLVP